MNRGPRLFFWQLSLGLALLASSLRADILCASEWEAADVEDRFLEAPVAFRSIQVDSGKGPVVVGYSTAVLSGDPEKVHKLVVEALSRFQIPADHIRLSRPPGRPAEITVGLKALKDPRLAPHIAYHAEHHTLRPFFARLELAGQRVQDMLFNQPPESSAAIVKLLTPEDADVLAQWSRTREQEGKKLDLKELIDCG